MEVLICAVFVKILVSVPFITFEYYLIMFEHVFSDASHLMSHTNSLAFHCTPWAKAHLDKFQFLKPRKRLDSVLTSSIPKAKLGVADPRANSLIN